MVKIMDLPESTYHREAFPGHKETKGGGDLSLLLKLDQSQERDIFK
jgi:hypothetical protein